jgi:hypothetical protein
MFNLADNEFVINILIASVASVLNTLFTTVLSAILGLPTS